MLTKKPYTLEQQGNDLVVTITNRPSKEINPNLRLTFNYSNSRSASLLAVLMLGGTKSEDIQIEDDGKAVKWGEPTLIPVEHNEQVRFVVKHMSAKAFDALFEQGMHTLRTFDKYAAATLVRAISVPCVRYSNKRKTLIPTFQVSASPEVMSTLVGKMQESGISARHSAKFGEIQDRHYELHFLDISAQPGKDVLADIEKMVRAPHGSRAGLHDSSPGFTWP